MGLKVSLERPLKTQKHRNAKETEVVNLKRNFCCRYEVNSASAPSVIFPMKYVFEFH